MQADWEGHFAEAIERVELLAMSLPTLVDSATTPQLQKVAYKYLVFRETLIWRTEELGRAACREINDDRVISAFLLTRGVAENAAALNYVHRKMNSSLNSGSVCGLDEIAMRLLMGQRHIDWEHQAVNVLTMIDDVERDIPGFRSLYDVMSEYAHPNWSGTSLVYSEIDHVRRRTIIGKLEKRQKVLKKQCLNLLNLSLLVFGERYNAISGMFLEFNALCAEKFDKASS